MNSLLFSHFFACIFHLIALNSNENENWLTHYSLEKKSAIEQYLYSLYWSTITMMTVGYGDIVPQNSSEMAFALFTVLCGCIVFGYNLNRIGNIFHEMNKGKKKMQEKLTKINKFMESKHMNSNLQMRIRAYLKFIWANQNEKLNKELLNIIDDLSDTLKEEFYLHGYGNILRNHSLFSDNFSENFLSSLLRNIEEETYMKDEIIFRENEPINHNLYFIISGEIEVFHSINRENPRSFKKIRAKDSFGEYSFLTGLNHIYSAQASEYTKIYKISRERFHEVLTNYPNDYEKYSELRDKIILYGDFNDLKMRCLICNKRDHLIENCNLVHYTPNKEIIFLRYLFSENQERNSYHRKKKKINSLHSKKKFFSKHEISSFNRIRDSEENLSMYSSFDSNQEIENSGCPNIMKIPVIELTEKNKFDGEECSISRLKSNLSENEIQNIIRLNSADDRFTRKVKTLDTREHDKNSTITRATALDFEHVKHFDYYFPDSNVGNFIKKYKKFRKLAIKEKKTKKQKKQENSPNKALAKKSGYAFFIDENKQGTVSKSFREERLCESPALNTNKGFFSIRETKQPDNFMDLIQEIKKQKLNKK